MSVKLSVILPIYNEAENLEDVLRELQSVLQKDTSSYEMICVDDASTDGSAEVLQRLKDTVDHLKIVCLKRHSGQTAAMAAGFSKAEGQVVAAMDADYQNDPHNIPALVKKLSDGYDVVSGWRRSRRDGFVRTLFSRVANRALALLTGIPLHDFGCTLKVYRREILQDVTLYGEMHRILPAYLAALGARIGEMKVQHRSRRFGRSKYGLGRTIRVLLDMLAVAFVLRFSQTPIRAFGGVGLIFLVGAILTGTWVVGRVLLFGGTWVSPLIFATTVMAIAGVQFIVLGLLGEMLLWTQATSARRRTYTVEEENPQV